MCGSSCHNSFRQNLLAFSVSHCANGERKVCRRTYSVSVPFRSLSVLDKKIRMVSDTSGTLKGRTYSIWMGQTLKFIGTHG